MMSNVSHYGGLVSHYSGLVSQRDEFHVIDVSQLHLKLHDLLVGQCMGVCAKIIMTDIS